MFMFIISNSSSRSSKYDACVYGSLMSITGTDTRGQRCLTKSSEGTRLRITYSLKHSKTFFLFKILIVNNSVMKII